jgi:argininosuccinate synthase
MFGVAVGDVEADRKSVAHGKSVGESVDLGGRRTIKNNKGAYDQADAGGFIRLNALRMRIEANAGKRN